MDKIIESLKFLIDKEPEEITDIRNMFGTLFLEIDKKLLSFYC
jgi:hypothetical protein